LWTAPMSDDEVQSHETNGTGHLAMDEAFSARMRAAIAAGLENAPIVSSSRLEPKSPNTSFQSNGR
jgi:hypothetical protein